jgi:integrase
MPRQPQPWFRKGRGWYVQLNGKKVFLGHGKKEAQQRFHETMAAKPAMLASIPRQGITVVSVLDAFLDWLGNRVQEGTKAQRTFDWYKRYLQSFASFGTADYAIGGLTIEQIEPFHIYQWADSHPRWKTGKRGAMSAVQRAFCWAARAGLLNTIGGQSPLAALEKPPQGRREELVSDQEYREALSAVNDQEFRDLLELAWETGSRPHELFTVEAAFVEPVTACWVFPIRLSKGRKTQRVVYLSDRALEITRRLMLKRPNGPLLLNTEGKPWCVSSVKCRFQRICRELGRRRLKQLALLPPKVPRLSAAQRKNLIVRAEHELKVLARRRQVDALARRHGTRLNLYAFRHSRITEALVNGLGAVTVSVLAGHRDTTMISRHYAHLTQRHEHMRQAANKATASSA